MLNQKQIQRGKTMMNNTETNSRRLRNLERQQEQDTKTIGKMAEALEFMNTTLSITTSRIEKLESFIA